MNIKIKTLFTLSLVLVPSLLMAEKLPLILEQTPKSQYEVLSNVSATMKTISQAQSQLQIEARKVNADAIIKMKCDNGGLQRQGLTWSNAQPSCQGVAISFRERSRIK